MRTLIIAMMMLVSPIFISAELDEISERTIIVVNQEIQEKLEISRKKSRSVEKIFIKQELKKYFKIRRKSKYSKSQIRELEVKYLQIFNAKEKYLSIPHMTVELLIMDDQQWIDLITVRRMGRPFNLSNSLFGLGWHESNAGKVLVNWKDPSFGFFHILLATAMNRHPEYPKTNYYENMVSTWLLDLDYNTAEAISELEYWTHYHGRGYWSKAWASWNTGFNYKSRSGKLFALKIKTKIKVGIVCVPLITESLVLRGLIDVE